MEKQKSFNETHLKDDSTNFEEENSRRDQFR